MGIANQAVGDIACYRVVYEFLGTNINPRMALSGCGTFDLNTTEVSKFIRDRIVNDIRPSENSFHPTGIKIVLKFFLSSYSKRRLVLI